MFLWRLVEKCSSIFKYYAHDVCLLPCLCQDKLAVSTAYITRGCLFVLCLGCAQDMCLCIYGDWLAVISGYIYYVCRVLWRQIGS